MTNNSKVLILSAAITATVLAVVFGGLALYNQDPTVHKYTGKEVFDTNQGYQEFKEFIAQKGVEILDIQALHSEPPIIVAYQIAIPAEMAMPFTYEYKVQKAGPHQDSASAVWGGGTALGLFLIIGLSCLLWPSESSKVAV